MPAIYTLTADPVATSTKMVQGFQSSLRFFHARHESCEQGCQIEPCLRPSKLPREFLTLLGSGVAARGQPPKPSSGSFALLGILVGVR